MMCYTDEVGMHLILFFIKKLLETPHRVSMSLPNSIRAWHEGKLTAQCPAVSYLLLICPKWKSVADFGMYSTNIKKQVSQNAAEHVQSLCTSIIKCTMRSAYDEYSLKQTFNGLRLSI